VTEIISERSIAGEGEDGWRVEYRVRCNDGRQVVVEAECSRPAESSIKSAYADAYLADQGRAAAIEHAEKSQPSVTELRLWVDHLNGSIHADPLT
jgi:hypothetical protein